jgi:predicted nucleic acid-binding OB-fold protein
MAIERTRTKTNKRSIWGRAQIVEDSENTFMLFFDEAKPINLRRNKDPESFAKVEELFAPRDDEKQ